MMPRTFVWNSETLRVGTGARNGNRDGNDYQPDGRARGIGYSPKSFFKFAYQLLNQPVFTRLLPVSSITFTIIFLMSRSFFLPYWHSSRCLFIAQCVEKN